VAARKNSKIANDNTVADINTDYKELIDTLKFTPCTYKLRIWGYGGEYVMGTVDRKIYDYFKQRRLDVEAFAWDSDYADENNIPEDMQPFFPGSWHECDNMGHSWGADRNVGTIQVENENGDIVYEKPLEDVNGYDDDSPELSGGEEVWIDSQEKGTVVFIGVSSEKGTFFEADINLKMPFNPTKLCLTYDEIDGNEIITSVSYDGEELENQGGDTNGKGSDFGFYIAGSLKDGKWERYKNMDDINYGLTAWFPVKTKPLRTGQYNIKTKDGYEYRAEWTGEYWKNTWSEDKLKITTWQGIAYDPDEHFLREELDDICKEFYELSDSKTSVDQQTVECVACDWSGTSDQSMNEHEEMMCPVCGHPVKSIN